MLISLVAAADEKNGIGKNNQLLCYLPADLKFFKQLTMGHHVLMGRKSYESVGKPLPGRTNIIITRQHLSIQDCFVFNSIEEGIIFAKNRGEEELFIIGGDNIFRQSLQLADLIYLTRIHHHFDADAFFPVLDDQWQLIKDDKHAADEKNKFEFSFQTYKKV